MPPNVIQVDQVDDPRDVVHRAVQALAEGQVIALAGENGYQVAGSLLSDSAVQQLQSLFSDFQGQTNNGKSSVSLVLRGPAEIWDYVPKLTKIGRRLVGRGWPGPFILQLPLAMAESLVGRLPQAVQEWLLSDGMIRLQVPDHPLLAEILKMSVGPVALVAPEPGVEPTLETAEEVRRTCGSQVPLILDQGPCPSEKPATVVYPGEQRFEVFQPGVVPESTLIRLASMIIVFVCTGNTCRSPMAEALCRQLVAEKLDCSPEELEKRGIIILSAGLAAMHGSSASPEAVDLMTERGASLTDHASQPLSEEMVLQADSLLVMTRRHQRAILEQFPEAADRVFLLCHDHDDVTDPIGGSVDVYRACANQIEGEIRKWIEKWDFSQDAPS
ncbi:Threonylcarbamoyl-AMP synthase [Planctomycetales bacterium 10988]|nr:Threonylcarbamoyl-AMP synthase [Planctomycetales bacterium 10988]